MGKYYNLLPCVTFAISPLHQVDHETLMHCFYNKTATVKQTKHGFMPYTTKSNGQSFGLADYLQETFSKGREGQMA